MGSERGPGSTANGNGGSLLRHSERKEDSNAQPLSSPCFLPSVGEERASEHKNEQNASLDSDDPKASTTIPARHTERPGSAPLLRPCRPRRHPTGVCECDCVRASVCESAAARALRHSAATGSPSRAAPAARASHPPCSSPPWCRGPGCPWPRGEAGSCRRRPGVSSLPSTPGARGQKSGILAARSRPADCPGNRGRSADCGRRDASALTKGAGPRRLLAPAAPPARRPPAGGRAQRAAPAPRMRRPAGPRTCRSRACAVAAGRRGRAPAAFGGIPRWRAASR